MFIQPTSNVKLYSDVPLDNAYEHTLYFANKDEQNNYFHGEGINLLKYFTNLTYVRVNKGSITVEANYGSIYNANYMAFKNENFENKWFYAFVTKVDYINNVTCEVFFEIDEMQTWFLDCTLLETFVEREMIVDDSDIPITDEPTLTQSIYQTVRTDTLPIIEDKTPLYLLIAKGTPEAISKVFNYMINATQYTGYIILGSANEVANVYKEYILTGKENLIETLCITYKTYTRVQYVKDSFLEGKWVTESMREVESFDNLIPLVNYQNVDVNLLTHFPNTADGYIPRNNKCLIYPYQKVELSNNNGDYIDIAPNMFYNTNTPRMIRAYYDIGINNVMYASPVNYKGSEGSNFNLGVKSDFNVLVQAVSSNLGLTKLFNMLTDGITNISSSLVKGNNITPDLIHFITNSSKELVNFSPTSETPSNNSSLVSVLNIISFKPSEEITTPFKIEYQQLLPNIIKMYDEYFGRYGYSTQRVKVPNINVRPIWNYVKTNGCIIEGKAPTTSINAICKLFDKGITFWKGANNVGKYLDANGNIKTNK